jgi:hypothetical protein
MVVPSGGGEPQVVYRPADGTWLATPAWSPDGETIWRNPVLGERAFIEGAVAFMQAEPMTTTTDRTRWAPDGRSAFYTVWPDWRCGFRWQLVPRPPSRSVLVASETNVYEVDIVAVGVPVDAVRRRDRGTLMVINADGDRLRAVEVGASPSLAERSTTTSTSTSAAAHEQPQHERTMPEPSAHCMLTSSMKQMCAGERGRVSGGCCTSRG